MEIAPWLQFTPDFFTGQMRAGTAAGTALRGQDLASSEAADRLRLAYNSLAEKEQMAGEVAKAKQQQAQAAMELRSAQLQGLQDYREQQQAAKEKQLELGGANLDLKRQLGESNLALTQERIQGGASKQARLQSQENRLEQHNALSDVNARIATVRKQLDALQVKGESMTPAEKDTYKAAGQELMGLLDQQAKINARYAPLPTDPVSAPTTSTSAAADLTAPNNRLGGTDVPVSSGGVKLLKITRRPSATNSSAAAPGTPSAPQQPITGDQFKSAFNSVDPANRGKKAHDALKVIAGELVNEMGVPDKWEKMRIGSSTLYHDPANVFLDALYSGESNGFKGEDLSRYFEGLPADTKSRIYKKAMDEAGLQVPLTPVQPPVPDATAPANQVPPPPNPNASPYE